MIFKVLVFTTLIAAAYSQGYHPSRPPYAPVSFDCKMRRLAYEYAKTLQPWNGEFSEVFDALELGVWCNDTVPPKRSIAAKYRTVPDLPPKAKNSPVWYVKPSDGTLSGGRGTSTDPFLRLQDALEKASQYEGKKYIYLMPGTHFTGGRSLHLTHLHSDLVISGIPGQQYPTVSGGILLQTQWMPYDTSNGKNIYVTDLTGQVSDVPGLQLDGRRAFRARYPNCDPETTVPDARVTTGSWLPPKKYPDAVQIKTSSPTRWWMQTFQNYKVGINGPCSIYDPPVSYWCSNETEGGGAFSFRVPSGLVVNQNGQKDLPNYPYKNGARDATVNIWRPDRWETWMFNFSSWDNGTFVFDKGGFQGARGNDVGSDWYIENVFDELDYPNEYFFDKDTGKLYLYYNGTGAPPASLEVVATSAKVLFSVVGASQSQPVVGLTVQGTRFTAAAATFMDPHSVPSGGDWSLQRGAAIFFENTEKCTFQYNIVERVDGNGLMLSGYNRESVIQYNDFAWMGDSAILSWGRTEDDGMSVNGISGMAGNQPRGSKILYNVVHELGMSQKQSSFYMQAKSAQALIKGNVMFNGPRAGVNFNDGFGGATELTENLIFNTCRESSDHGPFNSWDRQPFLTDVLNGTPSLLMDWQHIHRNFMIANYESSQAIDNDDGSGYYHSHHNVLIYSPNGMKSDFSGHDNHHHDNLFAYLDGHCLGLVDPMPGHVDYFYNNFCVMDQSATTNYGDFTCNSDITPILHSNQIFTPSGKTSECGLDLIAYQAKGPNHDPGTNVTVTPPDDVIINYARMLLGLP